MPYKIYEARGALDALSHMAEYMSTQLQNPKAAKDYKRKYNHLTDPEKSSGLAAYIKTSKRISLVKDQFSKYSYHSPNFPFS